MRVRAVDLTLILRELEFDPAHDKSVPVLTVAYLDPMRLVPVTGFGKTLRGWNETETGR